jgi:hypothetical protein
MLTSFRNKRRPRCDQVFGLHDLAGLLRAGLVGRADLCGGLK